MDAWPLFQQRLRRNCRRHFVCLVGCGLTALGGVVDVDTDRGSLWAKPPVKSTADASGVSMKVASESVLKSRKSDSRIERNLRQISQTVEAPVPENLIPLREDSDASPENLPSPDMSPRRVRATIPAQKMTIRIDPVDRQLGDPQQTGIEGGQGLTIRSVQEEIERNEQNLELSHQVYQRYSNYNWENELPYGKYIYIHHAPLLFEDIPLERYGEGHGHCVQPVISFAKFVTTVPLLPYKITADYWAAYHYDLWYSFDQYGNMRPGVTEGRYFPGLRPLTGNEQSWW